MTSFQRLRRSAHTVNGMAAVLMALAWIGAVVTFIYPRFNLASPGTLFISGAVIGILGSALSQIMESLADHMEDTHAVREDLDRLMKRIEKK